jgi:outer membrane protein OmpA-like peptidoglycan-associated protein
VILITVRRRFACEGLADGIGASALPNFKEDHMTNLRSRLMQAVVTGSLTWLAFGTQAVAGDLSQQQIFDALTPRQMTRSLTAVAPTGPDHQALIANLRHRGTRSLTTTERTELAAMADERPAVDLQIYFDFDSATITPRAVPQLTNLGNALAKPGLRDSMVTINGHTDGKGTDAYNQRLSEQRAETIKQYLVEHFPLSSENLVAVGYGKQKPKNAGDLFAAENRRVEIVNLASQN